MKIKPTYFRQNLYQMLDMALDGEEVEIERNGRTLVLMEKKGKDIYQIFDSRKHVKEDSGEYLLNSDSALDNDWEEQWDKQWDEWLKEK